MCFSCFSVVNQRVFSMMAEIIQPMSSLRKFRSILFSSRLLPLIKYLISIGYKLVVRIQSMYSQATLSAQ
ncbi:hypothetical protein FGO68_gene2058 [Halteria grandinella]|uniref:Uncharacterized protein n=1 Tax=Halteria grandinella TaxID=5974 RepID=A0A8J8T394_HALGN|nr:hypothetical protein FGO68_gene2058 [Halteria grandinella]